MSTGNSTGPHLHFSTDVNTGTPVYAANPGSIRASGPGYFHRGEWNGETHEVWRVPVEYQTKDDWKQHSQYLGAYTTEQIKNGEHRDR